MKEVREGAGEDRGRNHVRGAGCCQVRCITLLPRRSAAGPSAGHPPAVTTTVNTELAEQWRGGQEQTCSVCTVNVFFFVFFC